MKNHPAPLKRFLGLLLLMTACFAFTAKADKNTTPGWEAWTHCMIPVKQEYNKNCTDNYFVQWQNTCGEPMDIKYSFLRADGRWMSGVIWGVKPGETRGGSACTATGKYYLWARPTRLNNQVKFPTDDQIKTGNFPEPNQPAGPSKN